MQSKNHKQISRLQNIIIEALVPLINSNYVLLDVPDYGNIGDHLIYEGQLLFLNKYVHKYTNRYTSNCNVCDFSKIGDTDVILLQAGGNFGDIYHSHQKFRQDIINHFKNNRIIILPQTVYYKDEINLKNDCSLFNQHPDLYICLRDLKSYNLLAQFMNKDKLILLPDMAFFIDFTNHKLVNSLLHKKALLMYRVDVEAVGDPDLSLLVELDNEGYTYDIKDWPTYYRTFDIVLYRLYNTFRSKLLNFLSKIYPFNNFITSDTNDLLLKKHYIKMGLKFMNPYSIVYTTRLHGLILAILLDKKVVILDNSYGKLSSFYDAWLSDFIDVNIVSK